MWRYILAWMPMIFIGIINGTIREFTYGKYLSELRAHQVSTLTGVLLFSLYIWAVIHFWSFESPKQALVIGCIWLGLTIAFEFLFGERYSAVQRRSLRSPHSAVTTSPGIHGVSC